MSGPRDWLWGLKWVQESRGGGKAGGDGARLFWFTANEIRGGCSRLSGAITLKTELHQSCGKTTPGGLISSASLGSNHTTDRSGRSAFWPAALIRRAKTSMTIKDFRQRERGGGDGDISCPAITSSSMIGSVDWSCYIKLSPNLIRLHDRVFRWDVHTECTCVRVLALCAWLCILNDKHYNTV